MSLNTTETRDLLCFTAHPERVIVHSELLLSVGYVRERSTLSTGNEEGVLYWFCQSRRGCPMLGIACCSQSMAHCAVPDLFFRIKSL